MKAELLAEILSRQKILILERTAAGAFCLVGRIPAWALPVLPPDAGESSALDPGSCFAFLEYFLGEAEPFWSGGGEGELRSGIWTENAPDGSELHLMAAACVALGKCLLLVRQLEAEFDQLQHVHQRGRELLLAHERLLSESSKKEILLHCIIHDLAGPLAGITSTLQILEKETLSESASKFIQLARRAARQQSLLIDDLLATFRAEIGSLETLDPNPAHSPDIIECARGVVEMLTPSFATRKLQCAIAAAPGLPDRVRVRAERGRLERLFHNLIQNAMRYSPAGGAVTVAFRREGSSIETSVEDEGSGIPPEIAPQLFQKFVRSGNNRGKAGLGLYFCRISVEQWGGSIGCEPRLGGGTRFWFRLNAA